MIESKVECNRRAGSTQTFGGASRTTNESNSDQLDVLLRPAEGAPDVYLRVTGVDVLTEELRTRGADIIDGPEDRVYGQRELVVTDW